MRSSSTAPLFPGDDPRTLQAINPHSTWRHPGLPKVPHTESHPTPGWESQKFPTSFRRPKMCACPSAFAGVTIIAEPPFSHLLRLLHLERLRIEGFDPERAGLEDGDALERGLHQAAIAAALDGILPGRHLAFLGQMTRQRIEGGTGAERFQFFVAHADDDIVLVGDDLEQLHAGRS